jgi:hypothetical protein
MAVHHLAAHRPRVAQAYPRGVFYRNRWTPQDVAKALDQFNLAVKLSKFYPEAYAGIASCYVATASLMIRGVGSHPEFLRAKCCVPKCNTSRARILNHKTRALFIDLRSRLLLIYGVGDRKQALASSARRRDLTGFDHGSGTLLEIRLWKTRPKRRWRSHGNLDRNGSDYGDGRTMRWR